MKIRSYPIVRETEIAKIPIGKKGKKAEETEPYHHMCGAQRLQVVDRAKHASASLQCVSNPRSLPNRHEQHPNITANVVPLAAPSPRAGKAGTYLPVHRAQEEHRQAYITGASL